MASKPPGSKKIAIDPRSLNLAQLEQQNGLPSGLLAAVMQRESAGNPNAVSPAGAMGLFQFMPKTAQAYGIDPLDPMQSAQGAARMYGDLSRQYGGDIPKMLAGYNWGSGNLAKYGMENAPKETRDYIAAIAPQVGQQPQPQQTNTYTEIVPTSNETQAPDAEIQWYLEGEKAGVLNDEEKAWLDQGRKAGFVPSVAGQTAAAEPPPNGLRSRIMQDFEERSADTKKYLNRDPSGQPSALGRLNAVGNAVGWLAGDIPGEIISQAASDAPEPLKQFGRELAASKGGKAVGSALSALGEGRQAFKENFPVAFNTVGSLANIASVGTGGKLVDSIIPEAPMVTKAAKIAPTKILTAAEIAENANRLYKKADEIGAVTKPEFASKFVNELEISKPKPIAGKVLTVEDMDYIKAVDEFKGIAGSELTLGDLQRLDESLGAKIEKTIDPKTGAPNKTGKRLIDVQDNLRDMIDSAGEADLRSGRQGLDAWKNAKSEWSRKMKMGEIEQILARAELSDNAAQVIRTGAKNLALNKKRSRGFNKEERAALEAAAKAGNKAELLLFMGSRLNPIIAGATGNFGGAIASHAVAVAARGAAEHEATTKLLKVAEEISKGSIKE